MEARTRTFDSIRGAIRRGWAGWLDFWRGRPRWLRVDVRDAGGRLVLLGNPIYLRP